MLNYRSKSIWILCLLLKFPPGGVVSPARISWWLTATTSSVWGLEGSTVSVSSWSTWLHKKSSAFSWQGPLPENIPTAGSLVACSSNTLLFVQTRKNYFKLSWSLAKPPCLNPWNHGELWKKDNTRGFFFGSVSPALRSRACGDFSAARLGRITRLQAGGEWVGQMLGDGMANKISRSVFLKGGRRNYIPWSMICPSFGNSQHLSFKATSSWNIIHHR